MRKYIVVSCDESNDLYAKEFNDYDEAYAYINGIAKSINHGKYGCDGEHIGEEKAILVKVESPLTCYFTVSWEDYT